MNHKLTTLTKQTAVHGLTRLGWNRHVALS